MVVLLDMVTEGGTTFVRALVPLSMSITGAVFLALFMRVIRRLTRG
jgi:hypothetical protein